MCFYFKEQISPHYLYNSTYLGVDKKIEYNLLLLLSVSHCGFTHNYKCQQRSGTTMTTKKCKKKNLKFIISKQCEKNMLLFFDFLAASAKG